MARYVIRRLLLTIPVVFVALSLIFVMFFVLPGDTARYIAGGEGRQVPPETLAAVRAKYHLDDPLPVQYVNFWKRTLSGDFGTSYQTGEDVSDLMRQTGQASLRLAIWAIVFEIVFGVLAGFVSARRRGSIVDGAITIGTVALAAVPVFVLGLLLQQLTGVVPNQHGWPEWMRLPTSGIGPDSWTLFFIPTGDQWKYMIQPVIVLAAIGAAIVARVMRGSMIDAAGSDYMRTARAKGLSESQAMRRHGMRNAMIPVVTIVGIDFAALIGAAVLTEFTFSWPGVGSSIASAIEARDAPVLLGLSLIVVLAYVLVNLVVDISYAAFDPRVRASLVASDQR